MAEEIKVEIDDPVCTITLNRPDVLNAFTFAMLGTFREAVEAAARNSKVFGIVVTGEGRGFCSGLDASVLQATANAGSTTRPERSEEVPGLFTWLLQVPKPVIAAVNGVAAGGGFVLATMSDLRFASTSAQFTSVFSKRGLIAEHGMTWSVPRLIGTGAALDLLWSSRKIDGSEAYRLGLVENLVESDDLLPACRRYLVDLSEQVSPASVADTKRLVYEGYGTGYRVALEEIDRAQYAALDRVDAKEGVAALMERRLPSFPRLGEQ